MSEQSEPMDVVQSEPVTEAVEAVETQEVEQDAQPDEGEEPRKPRGVQKRIDELTSNWRNAERREQERAEETAYWRNVALQFVAPQPVYAPEPVYDDQGFAYDPEPVTRQPTKQLTQEEIRAEVQRLVRLEREQETWDEKTSQFKASVSDPETQDFLNSKHAPISDVMADIMLEHEAGPQIAGWLARNQSEAARIAKLPPHKAALELLKVSEKATAPKPVKTTAASAPVPTLGGRAAPDVDAEKMPIDQWMKWRQGQLKRG